MSVPAISKPRRPQRLRSVHPAMVQDHKMHGAYYRYSPDPAWNQSVYHPDQKQYIGSFSDMFP